jgi:hypothetical protein
MAKPDAYGKKDELTPYPWLNTGAVGYRGHKCYSGWRLPFDVMPMQKKSKV